MSNKRPDNWRPGRRGADPARQVAYEALLETARQDAYVNLILPRIIRRARLGKRDAAYATNLTYGTVRMQGRWDAIAAHCLNGRPFDDLDVEVQILLRLGIHQLLELGTPAHAAINETVTLTRNVLGTGASGLVNAALHRASERTLAQWQAQLKADAGGSVNSVQFLSQWFSHPAWIIRALDAALKANGRTHKDLISLLQADNAPAQVTLVARGISIPELREDIERGHMDSRPGTLVDSALVLEGGDPHRVFAVKDRLAGVQDEGSQLVAKVLANSPLEGRDELWLDMCAGPGGKTATLAALAAQRGIEVHANELHEHRLDLVEQAVEPWSDIVALRLGEGQTLAEEEPEVYDRVLVDAPCTGIGALRRRPESRWRKEAGDALDLAKVQAELLEAAWRVVRPGGLVLYSTCSPYVKETHDIVNAFVAAHAGEPREPVLLDTPQIASRESLVDFKGVDGHLQLWPDLHSSDAMYMALIQKPVEENL